METRTLAFSAALALKLVGEAIAKGKQQFVIKIDNKHPDNNVAVTMLEACIKEGKEFIPVEGEEEDTHTNVNDVRGDKDIIWVECHCCKKMVNKSKAWYSSEHDCWTCNGCLEREDN
ncbi:hypothetical protein LCGC14_0775540 [marine sediment metagenome]|uniref:Uncharacterized protein n=1 Tax=marine sediment metagenome TaxID=412755 RepID=A0A0F9Q1D2_9ZZZZ